MRLTPALAAALCALAAAGAASAQAPPAAAAAPGLKAPLLPDELTRKSAAEDQAEADAMTARLAALDADAEANEARMTQLRDWDLRGENTRILAIKPALRYGHNPNLLHYFYW